jgi:quinol monooxygenase YgiN
MIRPYTVVAKLTAKSERRQELYELLSGMIEPTRAEEGCINYDLHVDAEDHCIFMFYENWRSREDLDRHLKTTHLKPLLERADELLVGPIEAKSYLMLSRPATGD